MMTDLACVAMLVRRPRENEREVLDAAEITPEAGLVGDCWARLIDERCPA